MEINEVKILRLGNIHDTELMILFMNDKKAVPLPSLSAKQLLLVQSAINEFVKNNPVLFEND